MLHPSPGVVDRQTLATLSTAESELVETVEGALLLKRKSVEGVIQEIAGLTPRLTGSWKTRHLRSSWLKEQVSTGQMSVVHEPGETQVADVGTKPLPRQRLQELVALATIARLRLPGQTAAVQCNRFSWLIAKLALLAPGLCGAAESSSAGEVKDPLPVEFSIELYVFILMLVVCAVAF